MKLEIELTNNKLYRVTYNEPLEIFVQFIQFEQGNPFLKADDGTYLSVSKIVRFNVLENNNE